LNEKKTITLPPEEAYGHRNEKRMRQFPRTQVPPGITPQVGQILPLTTAQGQKIPARIVAVDDEKIILDLNHPLAGETLVFEIEVVSINDTLNQ
jgi:peptidylprolyl isomerase